MTKFTPHLLQAHQLSKTVEQITTVNNVKHTLLKCIPCLRKIFARSLSETLGQHPLLCVKTTEGLGAQVRNVFVLLLHLYCNILSLLIQEPFRKLSYWQ